MLRQNLGSPKRRGILVMNKIMAVLMLLRPGND
jgi:hypothetical protein